MATGRTVLPLVQSSKRGRQQLRPPGTDTPDGDATPPGAHPSGRAAGPCRTLTAGLLLSLCSISLRCQHSIPGCRCLAAQSHLKPALDSSRGPLRCRSQRRGAAAGRVVCWPCCCTCASLRIGAVVAAYWQQAASSRRSSSSCSTAQQHARSGAGSPHSGSSCANSGRCKHCGGSRAGNLLAAAGTCTASVLMYALCPQLQLGVQCLLHSAAARPCTHFQVCTTDKAHRLFWPAGCTASRALHRRPRGLDDTAPSAPVLGSHGSAGPGAGVHQLPRQLPWHRGLHLVQPPGKPFTCAATQPVPLRRVVTLCASAHMKWTPTAAVGYLPL